MKIMSKQKLVDKLYSSCIHTIPNLETTQMSINRGINTWWLHSPRRKNELLVLVVTWVRFKYYIIRKKRTQNSTRKRGSCCLMYLFKFETFDVIEIRVEVPCGERGRGVDCKVAGWNFLERWKCSVSPWGHWLKEHIHWSKLIELYQ